MKYLDRKNFSFASKALAEDTFEVVKFNGTESLSKPYEFAITLSAEDPDIDLKAVLRNPATLKIVREDEEIPIHGVPAVFEQLHEANHRIFYRAVLVPKLWYLGLYRDNRLFLDKTIPQIIEEILKQAGLTAQDYELKLTRSYTPWEHVCQYRESNLDFISRWMEREGIYYFFKQLETSEKLIITDNSTVHENIQGDSTLSYSPASGLIPEEEEVVSAFVCRQRVLPKKVILKDYNYRRPSLEVEAEADVDPNGREEVYIYGEHFKDPSQGKELATVRAEEFLCRETMHFGEGTAPRLAPGFLFELARHYRSSCNRKFLVTEVEHRGVGTGLLLAGIPQNQDQGETQPGYSNHFVCIPSDAQFRPERKTPRPRFNGTMNAVVDAAGDGSTAELDDQGRYKVILPLDLSGRNGGKASRWIRMAQPYSGPDYGVHFPLHKGSEVLLTFIDGDLDRPVISGAVPNPETQSPVTNANQTKSIMRDNYGNEIIMDATPGDEHVSVYSPHHKSLLQVGKSVQTFTNSDHYRAMIGNDIEAVLGLKASMVGGGNFSGLVGISGDVKIGPKFNFDLLGGSHQVKWKSYDWSYSDGAISQISNNDINLIAHDDTIISANNRLCMVGGAGVPPEIAQAAAGVAQQGAQPQGVQGAQAGAGAAPQAAQPQEDSTSILLADEDSIVLSIGKKGAAFAPDQKNNIDRYLAYTIVASLITAGTSGLSAGLTACENPKAETAGAVLHSTILLSLALLVPSMMLFKRELESDENTPSIVSHNEPAGKIEMRRDGSIHVNSNPGAQISSPKKKIVLGVGQEQDLRQMYQYKIERLEKEQRQVSQERIALSMRIDSPVLGRLIKGKLKREQKIREELAQLRQKQGNLKNESQVSEDARITLVQNGVVIESGTRPAANEPDEYGSQINVKNDGSITLIGKQGIYFSSPEVVRLRVGRQAELVAGKTDLRIRRAGLTMANLKVQQ